MSFALELSHAFEIAHAIALVMSIKSRGLAEKEDGNTKEANAVIGLFIGNALRHGPAHSLILRGVGTLMGP